jgi:hypothetical protein
MDDQISTASCCIHPTKSKVVDPAVRNTDAPTGNDPRRACAAPVDLEAGAAFPVLRLCAGDTAESI